MAIIKDFGEKIGGARKDIWKLSGITATDFAEMNDMERSTYIKKDNIWIKPNWEQLVSEGTPPAVAFWQNKMRIALPAKPPRVDEESQSNYINVITQVRDAVMAVKDREGVEGFYRSFILPTFAYGSGYWHTLKDEAANILTSKFLNTAQASYYRLEREAKEKLFGIPKEDRVYVAAKQDLEIYCFDKEHVTLDTDTYDSTATRMTVKSTHGRSYYYLREGSEYHDMDKWKENTYFVMGKNRKPLRINIPTREEAEAFVESYARAAQIAAGIEDAAKGKEPEKSNRKKNFVPPQLSHVKYTGPKYRGIRSATGQMFLDDLKFRAGEFGNWLNQNDRQTSLDMGYDALRNLAEILNIHPEDISLNGHLAIAFGARGRGGAGAGAAHYEHLRQVINLTKMSGAGCLAHEWGHALDHAIGIEAGTQGFASEAKHPASRKIPDSFIALMTHLKYKDTVVSVEEQKKEVAPNIQNARTNLKNWIDSVKPSKIPEDLSKAWDEITSRILDNPGTFTGSEYSSMFGRSSITTHPDVEQLSQISKFVTNHVIPRNAKEQFALWANEINRYNRRIEEFRNSKRSVETDYYKGSKEFDKIYSKYGHGYWSSDCEMFARAFDCYIADKVKEQGYHSDYLSSNSDSFSFRNGDRVIYAYPCGEERTAINAAFDRLFEDLKDRGMLHDAPVIETFVEDRKSQSLHPESESFSQEPKKQAHYEQLSLDEILFAASARVSQQSSDKSKKSPEHSH